MTPKEQKARRDNLSRLCNRIKVDFSMKRIATLRDYLMKGFGYDISTIKNRLHYRDNELDTKLSFTDLKDMLEDLRLSLEAEIYLANNPPKTYDEETTETDTKIIEDALASRTVTIPSVDLERASQILDAEHNYGLEPSAEEKAFLFWFQKKYAKEILDKMRIHGLKGILLIAQAGTGKTFILGAVLRRLLDCGFHKDKSISPWPYCYVTKASVVEQTKRVMEKWFNIDTIAECFITNYDQLRASFGQLFVTEKTIVVSGQEDIVWEWGKMVHPCVFIMDESQACKNISSTQSKIVCAISEITHPHVYCIFSSATPFTRVSEAAYFVLNCRVDRALF